MITISEMSFVPGASHHTPAPTVGSYSSIFCHDLFVFWGHFIKWNHIKCGPYHLASYSLAFAGLSVLEHDSGFWFYVAKWYTNICKFQKLKVKQKGTFTQFGTEYYQCYLEPTFSLPSTILKVIIMEMILYLRFYKENQG